MKRIDIFPWDDNFKTGLSTVDEQHQQLVQMLNELASQFAFESDRIDLSKLFDGLLDYTVYHFETEEAIWREYLPDESLEVNHRESHKNFIDQLHELIDRAQLGPQYQVAEKTLEFLVRWLASHILESDRHLSYIVFSLQQGMDLEVAKRKALEEMSGFTRKMIDIILTSYGNLSSNTLHLMQELVHQKQLETQLLQQSGFLKTLIQTLPDLVWLKDPDGAYLACNSRFEDFLGTPEEKILGNSDIDLMSAEEAAFFRRQDSQTVKHGETRVTENWFTFADGHRELLEITKTPMVDQQGSLIGILGIGHDITECRSREDKLRQAACVFESAREGIMITNPDGVILDVNRAFCQITEYSREEVLGKNPRLLASGRHQRAFYESMWQQLLQHGHWSGEIWNRRKSGEVYVELLTITTVYDEQQNIKHYTGLFSDITSYKDQQKKLEQNAHYDALTRLPNRTLLADRLNQAMLQARRKNSLVGVVYLDLDGFKQINDEHGHDVGDQLLIQLSERLKQVLREGDTLSRLGGDEFVAVLPDIADHAVSIHVIERLQAAAATPVNLIGEELEVTASLGVTFYPQVEKLDPDQLLRQADQAMYQAKQSGKNRYHIFDEAHDRSVRGYHENLDRVRAALDQDEMTLYYQPKVNMQTGQILGMEALIRWQHPQRGLLLPGAFMFVVDSQPIAIQLGEWVLEKALQQISIWRRAGQPLKVSVNIDALHLQQPSFMDKLCELLALYPEVIPGDLELEVLETSALKDVKKISEIIMDCRVLGIGFALDDFGTGYSSLTYLKRLPAGLLKIDQSFVQDMLEDPEDLAILEGVLGLATSFRRKIIAEGVETLAHGEMLLKLGCLLGQGYAIARPMPADQVLSWLEKWKPHETWQNTKKLSRDDHALLFAAVEHRAWVSKLIHYLDGDLSIPPNLDKHQCQFGLWLDGHGKRRYADTPYLQQIIAVHDAIHQFADMLVAKKWDHRDEQLVEEIGLLKANRETLLSLLNDLLQQKKY
jgi:diguanylate cyclase (GGDEF)-like protein/hemerythrin-like metal-binding protein/PAS domain S-box-containing protein